MIHVRRNNYARGRDGARPEEDVGEWVRHQREETDEEGYVSTTEVVVLVVDDARDTSLGWIGHDGLDEDKEREVRRRKREWFERKFSEGVEIYFGEVQRWTFRLRLQHVLDTRTDGRPFIL